MPKTTGKQHLEIKPPVPSAHSQTRSSPKLIVTDEIMPEKAVESNFVQFVQPSSSESKNNQSKAASNVFNNKSYSLISSKTTSSSSTFTIVTPLSSNGTSLRERNSNNLVNVFPGHRQADKSDIKPMNGSLHRYATGETTASNTKPLFQLNSEFYSSTSTRLTETLTKSSSLSKLNTIDFVAPTEQSILSYRAEQSNSNRSIDHIIAEDIITNPYESYSNDSLQNISSQTLTGSGLPKLDRSYIIPKNPEFEPLQKKILNKNFTADYSQLFFQGSLLDQVSLHNLFESQMELNESKQITMVGLKSSESLLEHTLLSEKETEKSTATLTMSLTSIPSCERSASLSETIALAIRDPFDLKVKTRLLNRGPNENLKRNKNFKSLETKAPEVNF